MIERPQEFDDTVQEFLAKNKLLQMYSREGGSDDSNRRTRENHGPVFE